MKIEMQAQPPIEIERTDHPSKFVWPAWALRELGTMLDVDLARQLKIHCSTVAEERRRRGIAPAVSRAPIEWTDEMISRLGIQSDKAIAEILGISPMAVFKKRRELEIGPSQPQTGRSRGASPFWTPERDALLGTASDQKIANQLGIPMHQVAYRRKSLEIPAANPHRRIDWKPIDPLLGQMTDKALAEQVGIYFMTARRRRIKLKIPPFQAERRTVMRNTSARKLLFKPNQEIDEVSKGTVGQLRREFGIPCPKPPSRWTPEILARLGQEPDALIAEDMGLLPDTVRKKRYEQQRWLREPRRRWTEEEETLLLTIPDNHEAARRLGRTVRAIRHKRLLLAERLRD